MLIFVFQAEEIVSTQDNLTATTTLSSRGGGWHTPLKQNLLKTSTSIAEQRKKKLAALRTKIWRLKKKSAVLSTIVEVLRTQSLINQESADLLSSIDAENRVKKKDFCVKVLHRENISHSWGNLHWHCTILVLKLMPL